MLYLAIYLAATVAQLVAAVYAISLYVTAKSYRLASGFLALSFMLMLGRRIGPIYQLLKDGSYNPYDAYLSLAISLLMLLGIFHVKQVLQDLEDKNFLLGQSLKTDSLTHALSRPETFYRAKLEIEHSLRNKKAVSFLMLDIDHFKAVNDQYGHPVGDIVLKDLTKTCQQQLRVIDIFGRVGGEEFLVILPGADLDEAKIIAERLRSAVERTPCNPCSSTQSSHEAQKEIFITISIGVAVFDPLKDGATEAIAILKKYYELCDQAMYQAKQSGRNRISL